jgi:hypothetical protein
MCRAVAVFGVVPAADLLADQVDRARREPAVGAAQAWASDHESAPGPPNEGDFVDAGAATGGWTR